VCCISDQFGGVIETMYKMTVLCKVAMLPSELGVSIEQLSGEQGCEGFC
jgi:hypothetical protein